MNAKRIGVYGGSYGGFITLMALFTSPDTFAAGAALRPVTDWAHYNHGYTSNILNEPQARCRGLPQELADLLRRRAEGAAADRARHGGRQRALPGFGAPGAAADRIAEGELGACASYPVEDHGFVEATSWADEYKRILKLFETHLKK